MSLDTAQTPPAKPFLGRYQLQKKLAVGGMAEIYLAHVEGVGGFRKQVVVKRILPQLAESEELFEMFLNEARIAATLHHANIVQVYDACEENGEYFMAMEYLDGTDLRTMRNVLAESHLPMPWEHGLHIVSEIAAGLQYAHDKCAIDGSPLGIVHRDVSPHNIFLTRAGTVKLVDFGIAKAQGRNSETAVGTLKGKLDFMAPEQCTSVDVDRRCDIYSLGVILYELTTGRKLYSSETEYELIKEIVEGEVTAPSLFMDYPEELEEILLKCLAKDPENRYSTAREIQADLEIFVRDYQLICSTRSFATFLEPLLEQASQAAQDRWKHRKEIAPIRIGNSGAFGITPPSPQVLTSAKRVSAHSDSSVHARLSAMAQLPGGDEMTRPVPSDILAKIREEERARLDGEQTADELDAVPRLARGSLSGEHSVSSNVVRRETSRSTVIGQPAAECTVHEQPTIEDEDFDAIDFSEFDETVMTQAVPERSDETPIATVIAPDDIGLLTQDDMRVTRKSSKVAWGLGLFAAAGLAVAALSGTSNTSSDSSPIGELPPQPEFGSVTVQAEPGARVWLYLGKTPINSLVIHTQDAHRVRIEHEGYQSLEKELGSSTWQHDERGMRFSKDSIVLAPLREGLATSMVVKLPELPPRVIGTRPAILRLQSEPTTANAWLFVGTTPGVTVGNLSTSQEVQLRITAQDRPPIFRSVKPGDFNRQGIATMSYKLPAKRLTIAPKEVKTDAAKNAVSRMVKSKVRNRPRNKQIPMGRPIVEKSNITIHKAKLAHPTPEWAK